MRTILCLLVLVGVAMAQRSSYAPRPVGYPDVLNRFKGDEDDLPNRVGGTNSTATQDQGPLQTPEGSIGDPYLLQHVPSWPHERQPFWFLNQQHIMNHRGQATQGGQQGQATGQQGQGTRGQGATGQQGQGTRLQGQGTRQQGQANRQQVQGTQVQGQQGQARRQQGGQQ